MLKCLNLIIIGANLSNFSHFATLGSGYEPKREIKQQTAEH